MLTGQETVGRGFQHLDEAEYYEGRVTGSERMLTDPEMVGAIYNEADQVNEYETVQTTGTFVGAESANVDGDNSLTEIADARPSNNASSTIISQSR